MATPLPQGPYLKRKHLTELISAFAARPCLRQQLVAFDEHRPLLRGQPLRQRPLRTHLGQVRQEGFLLLPPLHGGRHLHRHLLLAQLRRLHGAQDHQRLHIPGAVPDTLHRQ